MNVYVARAAVALVVLFTLFFASIYAPAERRDDRLSPGITQAMLHAAVIVALVLGAVVFVSWAASYRWH